MIDRYKAAGRFVEDDSFVPQPADLMFYDWQDSGTGDNHGYPDHVGTVESVSNGTIYVFEGNAGGGSTTTRAVPINGRYNRGFAAPDYASLADEDCQFADVPSSHWAYAHIQWAAENGIAVGISETEFAPDLPCTRAQALTMLWSMMGKPHPQGTFNPFRDVHVDDYFYKAVVWALETGITAGISPSEFAPDQICSRGQIITMMYNLAGAPHQEPVELPSGFGPGDYYYNAMLWASRHGIIAGVGDGNLAPKQACTRAMIVTMLHRYADM